MQWIDGKPKVVSKTPDRTVSTRVPPRWKSNSAMNNPDTLMSYRSLQIESKQAFPNERECRVTVLRRQACGYYCADINRHVIGKRRIADVISNVPVKVFLPAVLLPHRRVSCERHMVGPLRECIPGTALSTTACGDTGDLRTSNRWQDQR